MNILQMEDMIKGLPDQVLMQEAQMPSGQIPQFLALSEVQRRKEMRDKFQAPPQATVADQILQSGIASAMPQQPPQGGMAPPQGPPMGAPQGPVMAYGGGMMPYTMADGGAVPGGPLAGSAQADVIRESQSGKARFADFLRQNLTTPQGLGRLAAGALGTAVGGPLAGYAASAGFNRLFPMGPSALESAVQNVQQANNPFGMYGQSFAQAGADRQAALDQAGAMALGNRYQDYLNRMTNPFAGTGSGIVRDERLGNQSLNLGMDDMGGMGMYGGGQVPYRMQEGRTIPNFGVNLPSFEGSRNSNLLTVEEILKIPEELRTPEQNQIIASLLPQMQEVAMSIPAPQVPENIAPLPEAAPSAAPIDMLAFSKRQIGLTPDFSAMAAPPSAPAGAPPAASGTGADADSFLKYLPQVQGRVSAMMPPAIGFDVAGYTKEFKPQESDYLNPEFQKQRQAMVENLRAEAQKRREADIALAQRYMSEAEAPIKKAEEEAKKAAIGAVLTRLGAGLMRGDAAAGLASATESAESIIGRQRELSAAERRAAKQEFRAAEREAIRSERGSADQAFNMEAQNLTADENAQRQFVRDSKQFSQQVYGLLRDAGRDQRAAHMESVRLTFSISQAIDTALREQKREQNLTERQYMQTFGNIYDGVLKAAEEATFKDPVTGEERAPTGDELIDFVNRKTKETLASMNTSGPSGGGVSIKEIEPTLLEVNGRRLRFPDAAAAKRFKETLKVGS